MRKAGYYWIIFKHYGWVIGYYGETKQWYHNGMAISLKDINEIDESQIIRNISVGAGEIESTDK